MTTTIPRFNRQARPHVEQLESRDCPASVLDPNLAVRDAITGLNQPTGFAFLGANDVLITEKASGQVKRFTNGAANGVPLDLAVNSNSERGLLAIELHPNFAQQRVRLPVLDREHHRGRHGRRRRRAAPRQPGGPVRLERVGPDVRPEHHPAARPADRRRPAGARQPRRRQGQVRAGRQAVHHDRRRRPARADAEPAGRAVRQRAAGRLARRARAGRRPPDRGDPAAQRRRHRPAGQPVLPGRRRSGAGRPGRTSRRCSPTACATGSAWRSTRSAATCGTRRTATTRSARSTGSRPGTTWAGFRSWGRCPAWPSSRRSRTTHGTAAVRGSGTSACSRCAGRRPTSPTTPDEALARMFQVIEDAQAVRGDLTGARGGAGGVHAPRRPRSDVQLTGDGTLRFKLKATGDITGATQAHFHLAGRGQNGPVVAFLLPFNAAGQDFRRGETIAEGVLTDADLIARPGFQNGDGGRTGRPHAAGAGLRQPAHRRPPGRRDSRPDASRTAGQVSQYSDPEFSWKFEVAPVGLGFLERPGAGRGVRGGHVRRRGPDVPGGRLPVPVRPVQQPQGDRHRPTRGWRTRSPTTTSSSTSPRARRCCSAGTSASPPRS